MINTDLYELAHGAIPKDIQKHLDKIEKYLKRQRENVVGVTVLSNFCKDNDMTNFIHEMFPETCDFDIYRGLLVELRANYKTSIGDMQFLYPQLCKQRAVLELPKDVDKTAVIRRIRDMKEMRLFDVKGKMENTNELKLSPLYNSISIYETTFRDSEWGMNVQKLLIGYDISCDKFLINFWMFCLQKEERTISNLYSDFVTSKIEGASIKNLIDEQCQGIIEFITQKNDSELNYISDITTNCILRNEHEYFVYNHCVNLLGTSNRPLTMQTSMLAGLKVYKNLVNNQNKFKYVFPYDSGFANEFHSWDQMNDQQRLRLERYFDWDKNIIPFNTYLMSKVHGNNTDRFRRVETELQVIPQGFYNVVFCRVSTHEVYKFLGAKQIVQLQPGDNMTKISFPMSSKHLISKLLLDNYHEIQRFEIINKEYYDKDRKMLILPRELATRLLSFE